MGADGKTVLTASVSPNNHFDLGPVEGQVQAILVLDEDFLELEKVIGVPIYGVIGYEFFKYNPINVSIDLDGKIKTLPVVLCTVANSSQFGNGFTVSPKSDVTDGKIELCLLKPFSIWSAPSIIYRFFMKSGDKSRFSEIISFKKAKIKLSKKMAHYDGEPFEVQDELNISVVPKSLNILVG